MPKKKTLSALKKDLWRILSGYIKHRDNHTCWLCQKKVLGSSLHCSHILPKGQYPRYEFEEWNLKSLCFNCHMSFWHKNPLEAALKFQSMYPTEYTFALEKARTYNGQKKMKKEEVFAKIQQYTHI